MFTYKELKIVSAVPVMDILDYMNEIGAVCMNESVYSYNDLEIEITLFNDDSLPELGITRYQIEVQGDRTAAEEFLTAYRFRFLSAGG